MHKLYVLINYQKNFAHTMHKLPPRAQKGYLFSQESDDSLHACLLVIVAYGRPEQIVVYVEGA